MTWRHLPAHLFTAIRVPLAALLWLHPASPTWFLGILIAGGISDVLDGMLARALDADRSGDPKHIGSWLDPVCDKIFAFSCIAAAYTCYDPPKLIIALLLLREIFQIPLLVVYLTTWLPAGRHASMAAVPAGKLTTVLQFVAMICVVLKNDLLYVIAPTVAVTGALAVLTFLQRAYARPTPPSRSPSPSPSPSTTTPTTTTTRTTAKIVRP